MFIFAFRHSLSPVLQTAASPTHPPQPLPHHHHHPAFTQPPGSTETHRALFINVTETGLIHSSCVSRVATFIGAASPARIALPFGAGVLTQGAGHFARVVQHCSSQGSLTGIVQEAADVGPFHHRDKHTSR